MAKTKRRGPANRQRVTLFRHGLMVLTGLGFIAAMGGGIAALHMRANAETPPAAAPLITVAASKIRISNGYDITQRFAGRVEPARQTRLSFERQGLVRELLYEEGEKIEKGAVVARLDTSKLRAERDQLNAQLRELTARHGLALATMKRQGALNRQGWQSNQSFDEARFNLQASAAAMERVRSSIKSIDVDIGKSVLTAPFAGKIAARFIDEGTVVAPGTAVIELLQIDRRQLRVGVSVDAAHTLSPNQVYPLQFGTRTLRGRLITKRPDLQTGTRTVQVLIEILGTDPIPFGEVIDLPLKHRIQTPGAWLPVTALTEGRKGLWAVLTVDNVDDAQVIAREAAEVLHIDGDRAYVRGTFKDGAHIVMQGTNRITPGQKVSLAAPEPRS